MTVDMSVLEALGINLYSNAAAVLSELVANAWDADATEVSIDWQYGNQLVVIADNGRGMTVSDFNNRFLRVGYKKRSAEGTRSPKWNRMFMGRKGIGKLSVFSIADTVRVFSVTSESVSGLKISVDELRRAISQDRPYNPPSVEVPARYRRPGTVIELSDLKSKRADLTASALRKRLARRFDVISQLPSDEGGFRIVVNGTPITYADRAELKKLEFIWEFGDDVLPQSVLPADIGRFTFKTDLVSATEGWRVKGWIGTAKRPSDLTDDAEAGSLKNIIVLARKRPIQEGIIEKLDTSRLFGNYVTGQIEADFLDLDGDYEDIATSDRQRLIEDDPRVVQLQQFLRARFLEASQEWSEARPKKEGEDALVRFPKLRGWIDSRPGWQKAPAEKMIGTIASLEFEGKSAAKDRNTLFRSGILAFERVGLREVIEDLDNLSSMTAVDLLPVLARQDSYEAALWVDILRSRLEAISKFKEITSDDEKEKVLQQHLFNHLWMLDASWERATTSPRMEQDLREVEPGLFAVDASGNQITGRIDIRYATTGGKHVIVELKRYSVKTEIEDLRRQGSKYARALRNLLARRGENSMHIEVVFVLGHEPKAKDPGLFEEEDFILSQLASINGRVVLYDQLINNAKNQYADYLDASDKARELDEVLNTLDVE
ncbi:BbrUII/HgiDII family restriction enzyme [Micromonospora humi]|nr:ATP-binding protein [Micromonospora humi]